jgi:uncharacterized protein (DUF983 family)
VSEATPVRWQPDRSPKSPAWPVPRLFEALLRGARCTCPACGKTRLFRRFLKVEARCAACGAPLGLARADDAPPYFTIVVVGHLIVPGMLIVEKAWSPDLWVHVALWVPLTVVLAVALLQPIKGMTVGVLTSMGMLTEDGPG